MRESSVSLSEKQSSCSSLYFNHDRERAFEEMESRIEKDAERSELEVRLPFFVLGFNQQRQILLWYKGQIVPIPVSQLKISPYAQVS